MILKLRKKLVILEPLLDDENIAKFAKVDSGHI